MMLPHGKWTSVAGRLYYFLGAAYYLYHWILTVGLAGLVVSVFSFLASKIPAGVALLVVGLTLEIVGGSLWFRTGRRRLRGPNPGLQLYSVEETYILQGDQKYVSTRRVKGRALQHGVDHYQHKFQWTGKGTIEHTLMMPSRGRIELSDEPYGAATVCRIYFERPLRRGEAFEVEYTLSFSDAAGTFKPFLGMTIHDLLRDKLTLRVVFDSGSNRRYRKAIFLSRASDTPVWECEATLPQDRKEAAWVIPKPRVFYKYLIIW